MKEGNKLNKVLKYPGSKCRIADKLVDLIPPHHTYLEPYFGSGAVFFRKQPSDIESINDLDRNVVN
ncbi:MAG: DNA adenine methylase, partial [Lachnospiraceae bacterium]|nr:DNA adenine methylase [Lachnospiraceae bacterium]